jgi:ribose transport system substrate-binding protein
MNRYCPPLFAVLLMTMVSTTMCGCRVENTATINGASGESSGSAASGEAGSTAGAGDRLQIAFVTNQIADFWTIAKVGCEDAQRDLDIDAVVRMPVDATAVEQQRIIEDLLTSGIDGVAISPIAATDQVGFLNTVAARVPLITQDSDAPDSDRLLYIGMDNYAAGRMCGELVKEALPDGGQVALFIGRMEQDNSKYRRQGVIDVLMGRDDAKPGQYFDPVDETVEGDKYTIVGTFTDQGKEEVARQKAEDAINNFPELAAMVGLFVYNPPQCYEAIKQAGKLGKIQLIGFDEAETTLRAIKNGECIGTVVQDPYNYGYRSMEILAKILRGDKSVIPESKRIDIAPRKITRDNVDAFWDDLRAKLGG